jgi:drug/metabolite transporter (DMT)-like permease
MVRAAQTIERRHEPTNGVLAMQGAVVAFALQDAGVKWLLQFYALPELLALRSAIILIFTGIFLACRGRLWATCRLEQPLPVFGRGALIAGAFLCYFTALTYMPLADVMAIFFAVPILESVLSGPLLGEAVGWRRYLAILSALLEC